MKTQIRELAFKLGFSVCGFTSADKPQTGRHYLEWLAQGYHADMAWMERNQEKRLAPQTIMPDARTIICVGVHYSPFIQQTLSTPPSARIASYAHFIDYHKTVQSSLHSLVECIQQISNKAIQCKPYVDTGPVLERDLAQRAGLGFIGKHSHLVHRKLGNWLLLAEIITSLELSPDTPEKNRCGTCNQCIQCCPTGALRSPFRLDSRRCISYLTIEHKGSIPLEMRPLIGQRIFGCDECIAVCPWNRFSLTNRDTVSSVMKSAGFPQNWPFESLLQMEPTAFKNIFQNTPLERLKYSRFLRNVCVAAGNTHQKSLRPLLEKHASNPDTLIAEHAQWALSECKKTA